VQRAVVEIWETRASFNHHLGLLHFSLREIDSSSWHWGHPPRGPPRSERSERGHGPQGAARSAALLVVKRDMIDRNLWDAAQRLRSTKESRANERPDEGR